MAFMSFMVQGFFWSRPERDPTIYLTPAHGEHGEKQDGLSRIEKVEVRNMKD